MGSDIAGDFVTRYTHTGIFSSRKKGGLSEISPFITTPTTNV